jgi:hypothetical protein
MAGGRRALQLRGQQSLRTGKHYFLPHIVDTSKNCVLNTHTIDQVPLALIDSKLSCIVWPLNRVGVIDSQTTGTQAERVQVV